MTYSAIAVDREMSQSVNFAALASVVLFGTSLLSFGLVVGSGNDLFTIGPIWPFWYLGLFTFGAALLITVGLGIACVFRTLPGNRTDASSERVSRMAVASAVLFGIGLVSFGLTVAGGADLMGTGAMWLFWYLGLFAFGAALLLLAALGVSCVVRGLVGFGPKEAIRR